MIKHEGQTTIRMKQFIDYIPLFVFFSVWAMDERTITLANYQHSVGGIFSAAEFLLSEFRAGLRWPVCGTAKTGQISVDYPRGCGAVYHSHHYFS